MRTFLLSRVFKRIDANKDKKIDFQEFQQGLHIEGLYTTVLDLPSFSLNSKYKYLQNVIRGYSHSLKKVFQLIICIVCH